MWWEVTQSLLPFEALIVFPLTSLSVALSRYLPFIENRPASLSWRYLQIKFHLLRLAICICYRRRGSHCDDHLLIQSVWLQGVTQPALQSQDASSCQVLLRQSNLLSNIHPYHYNITSFVSPFDIPLGYWRPSSVIYGAVIPAQAYFWPCKMYARWCKSIQWLLLPLISHEHVTLFSRPLCFQSMPLHLFIFFLLHFSFSFLSKTDRPVNMAGHKVNGACLMAEMPFDDTT